MNHYNYYYCYCYCWEKVILQRYVLNEGPVYLPRCRYRCWSCALSTGWFLLVKSNWLIRIDWWGRQIIDTCVEYMEVIEVFAVGISSTKYYYLVANSIGAMTYITLSYVGEEYISIVYLYISSQMWTYQTAQKGLSLICLLYISLIPKMRFLWMNEWMKGRC